jgi:hypothetical protein
MSYAACHEELIPISIDGQRHWSSCDAYFGNDRFVHSERGSVV